MGQAQGLGPCIRSHQLPFTEPPLELGLQRVVPATPDAGVAFGNIQVLRIRTQRLGQSLISRERRIRLREALRNHLRVVDTPLQQRSQGQPAGRELIQQCRRVQSFSAVADIGDVEYELGNFLLDTDAPAMHTRSTAKVFGEHISVGQEKWSLIENRRRPESRGRRDSCVPVECSVKPIGIQYDRVRKTSATTATTIAESLVDKAVTAADDSLICHAETETEAWTEIGEVRRIRTLLSGSPGSAAEEHQRARQIVRRRIRAVQVQTGVIAIQVVPVDRNHTHSEVQRQP